MQVVVAASGPTVLRWDLDKTYLISHFESLRGLLRVPFERGEDKVAVPGVAALIQELHRVAAGRKRPMRVYFLSASPPQIGNAIRDKLALDGIEYDGITFKDQVHHIVRGRFDAVREQIGYKLEQLLHSARELEEGATELLFGDDWESDPFVYSLYADIVAGRVRADALPPLLERAEVHHTYVERILELAELPHAGSRVAGIYILRQRRVSQNELEVFGRRRLVGFDNYFECALRLAADGLLDTYGVSRVASELDGDPGRLADSFDAMVGRGVLSAAWVARERRALVRAGLMRPVAGGNLLARTLAATRRAIGLPPRRRARLERVPDYPSLVAKWSYKGRKEAADGDSESVGRVDDD